ncbi:CbtA family protein [Nonomuraea sp. FMUSA5-5]|uniref:CbtA family protein n=1 Tax=Nonomuraea composti TaxID=2720023 RepID=A0ABX1BDS1_9ACTN|nr:CbtA family protein [Nonomuraea sp. FMUSA5-5]NJP94559.1 CbtA family protein [Nonomuraea sp. FMUSA5-5]
MVRTLLVRGLLTGLLAGLIAGGFAFVLGEPHVDSAIALEEAAAAKAGTGAGTGTGTGTGSGSSTGTGESASHDHQAGHDQAAGHDDTARSGEAGGHDHGDEATVSRPVQKAGLFLATGLYGLAVGGVFALVFAGLRGRVGPRSDGRLALAAAGTAFTAVVLVPFLKYPANPPAVGDPETINGRTLLYVVIVLVGLAATAIAVATARRVTSPDPWVRWVAATGAFLVPVVAAWVLLPGVNEVPDGFPAALLWEFRIASLGTQLVFWAAFGVLFGWAGDRAAARHPLTTPGSPASSPLSPSSSPGSSS